jgi:transcriptional regulator GlxA family with amidase domain
MDHRIAAAVCRLDEIMVDGETPDERELAASAGLSLSRFRHIFHQALDCTPHQYARRARLIRAAVLLQRGHVQVKAVWLDLGFKSAAHFSRVFREQFGIQPSGFRDGGSRGERSARL